MRVNRMRLSRIGTMLLAATIVLGATPVKPLDAARSISHCADASTASPTAAPDRPKAPKSEAPADLVAIDRMISQRSAAISLASVALVHARDSDVRRMALRVAEGQAGELQWLRYARATWYADAAQLNEADTVAPPDKLAGPEHCPEDPDFDRRFLEQMVAYHRSAIETAQSAGASSEHSDLISFAESVIEHRGVEIAMMSGWLAEMESTPIAST